MAICNNTILNITLPKVWASSYHIIPSLCWSCILGCMFCYFYAASIIRGGRIPVFAQEDPDCPCPLVQFNVVLRKDSPNYVYDIGCYIIIHNVTGTCPSFGTWPSVIIQFSTLHDLRYGEKWLEPVKKPTILMLVIYVEFLGKRTRTVLPS